MSNANNGVEFKIWHDPSTGSDKAISWKDGDVYKTDDVTTASETVGGTGWYKMPSGKKYLIVPADYTIYGDEGDAVIVYDSSLPSAIANNSRYVVDNPLGNNSQYGTTQILPQVYFGISTGYEKWSRVFQSGISNYVGIAYDYYYGEGIALVTGEYAVSAQDGNEGPAHAAGVTSGATQTLLKFRIWVWER